MSDGLGTCKYCGCSTDGGRDVCSDCSRRSLVRNYTRTGFWIPTNTGDQRQLWLCQSCGSVVHDKDIHDVWHQEKP